MIDFPFAVVRDGEGNQIMYKAASSNPKWKLAPMGHIPALTVECADCSSDQNIHGFIAITALETPLEKPDIAALRDSANPHSRSAFWRFALFDSAGLYGEPRPIQLGGLTGWQLRSLSTRTLDKVTTEKHDIVQVAVTDGCGAVHVQIESSPSGRDEPFPDVIDLISAIQITKTVVSDQDVQEALDFSRDKASKRDRELDALPKMPEKPIPHKGMDFHEFAASFERQKHLESQK